MTLFDLLDDNVNVSEENTETFTNELGNSITVTVANGRENDVLITIVGPTSTCENDITTKEAQVLLKLLSVHLEKQNENK